MTFVIAPFLYVVTNAQKPPHTSPSAISMSIYGTGDPNLITLNVNYISGADYVYNEDVFVSLYFIDDSAALLPTSLDKFISGTESDGITYFDILHPGYLTVGDRFTVDLSVFDSSVYFRLTIGNPGYSVGNYYL